MLDFNVEFFAGNRRKLAQAFGGKAPIVISAHGLVQKTRDEAYPFAQESNFWYLTGISEPGAVLVIDGDNDYVICPERSAYLRTFYGEIDKGKLQKTSKVSEVYDHIEGWQKLGRKLKKAKHVATLKPAPAYMPEYGLYTNPSGLELVRQIKTYNPKLHLIDLRGHLAKLRAIKQESEIKALSKAVDESVRLHNKIKAKITRYKYENEIIADITACALKNNLALAYEPIVASGKNAVALHYENCKDSINPQKPLLIDAGLAYQNYCADITRTHLLSPSKRQQQIYKAVLAVQEFAVNLLQPATVLREYEKAVRQFMGEKLREQGLITTISDETINQYFPHRATHFLGIDAHDPGDPDVPLEPGAVLTVEPGIYIAKESIGIRIEDTVLITEDGNEVLSAKLSK
jgi:Xaa-Pro aminopeptidase